MALVTGTLYAKKSYGRSLFGELVSPVISQNEAEKVEAPRKTELNPSKEATDNDKDSVGSHDSDENSGENSEVKVQWKTVGSGGNKQKELGKGFFTPKTYESDDGESEQEDSDDKKTKSGGKRTVKSAGKVASTPKQQGPTSSRVVPRPKYKQPTPKSSGLGKDHKNKQTSNKQTKGSNKTSGKQKESKSKDKEEEESDDSSDDDQTDDSNSNKPYVIKPIPLGRHSDFLETIPEDDTLENVIDDEDLADIKRDLALKGIIQDTESVLQKSVSDDSVQNEEPQVEEKPHDKIETKKQLVVEENKKSKQKQEAKEIHKHADNKQEESKRQKQMTAERGFVYPNTVEREQEILGYEDDDDLREEGFKTNKSFEIRRQQAKYEREREEKRKSWFKPKFLRSKVTHSDQNNTYYSKNKSSYKEKQEDHKNNWIRKKPKSILTSNKPEPGQYNSRKLLQHTSNNRQGGNSYPKPDRNFDPERDIYSRSSSVMGNRPNSGMQWDTESQSTIGDDVSIGGEYFDDDEDWDGQNSPLKEEELHQLYEDIDRLDPSRMTNYNYQYDENNPSPTRAQSAAAFSTAGRSSYHVMNDPNYYIKKQRDNLKGLRPGSRESPNRVNTAMSSNAPVPLHLFDSMRYEQDNKGMTTKRRRTANRKESFGSAGRPVSSMERHERSKSKSPKRKKDKKQQKKKKKRVTIKTPETPVSNGNLFRNGGMAFGSRIYPIPDRKMTPMSQAEWEAEVRKIHGSPYYGTNNHERRAPKRSLCPDFFTKFKKKERKVRTNIRHRKGMDDGDLVLQPLCYSKQLCSFCDCMECSNVSTSKHFCRLLIATSMLSILLLMVTFLSTGIVPYAPVVQTTTSSPMTTTPLTTKIQTTTNPTTLAPTTKNPTTLLPTTKLKTTIAPTTIVPTTVAKTTVPLTTNKPTTILVSAMAPTSTANPTTVATTVQTTHLVTTVLPTTLKPTIVVATTNEPTTKIAVATSALQTTQVPDTTVITATSQQVISTAKATTAKLTTADAATTPQATTQKGTTPGLTTELATTQTAAASTAIASTVGQTTPSPTSTIPSLTTATVTTQQATTEMAKTTKVVTTEKVTTPIQTTATAPIIP